MADIVARAQGMLDYWASTYQVDRGVLLEHEVATVAELVAEVERLRSDLTLSLMGSELEKLGAERDELGQRLSKLEVEAERDQLKAAVERVREALDRVALDHRYTGEPTSTGYQGAADYIRAALDGDNQSGDRSPDWYDTHCPTCDAPEPTHTPTCAVVHHQSGDLESRP